MHNSAQTFVDSVGFIETGHHEVNADLDPNLGANSVLAVAVKRFDTQVLFDPFEEQLDLPPAFVNERNGQCRKIEVVGQKDQTLTGYGIDEAYSPNLARVLSFGSVVVQSDDLITSQTGGLIDASRLTHVKGGIGFCTNDKERSGLVNGIKASIIIVSTIVYIDTPSLISNLIGEVKVLCGTTGNADGHGDGIFEINLSMQLDGTLGSSERGAGKQGQTQINGSRIDGVNQLFEIQFIGILSIQSAGFANEYLSERFINSPIPMLIGVSKIGAGDFTANPHCVEMGTTSQTGFDIAKALPEGDLCKGHGEELITSCHRLADTGHRIEIDAAVKLLSVDKIGYLSENQASSVHPLLRMTSPWICQTVQMRHMPFFTLTA